MKILMSVKQTEVYMSFWTTGGEAGDSQVGEKGQTFGEQILAGTQTQWDTKGPVANGVLVGPSLSPTLNSYALR